ncbi:MAG: nuclear transport factor 2 family protein [Alphaproteobacteria bacterium]|nr:nuclear transport factor 2 family protein [Alphaproteobacteria bacterium]
MTLPAATLSAIADRLAIEDLFVRYTTALDRGDVETIVDCFTEDGALESPTVGTYSGRQGIRDFALRFARFRERGAQLRHVISNLAVRIEGDTAQATCYLLNLLTCDGRTEVLAPGRYECDLVREEGVWRFARRLVILDHQVKLDGI